MKTMMAIVNKYGEVVCELEPCGDFFFRVPESSRHAFGYLCEGDEFYVEEVEVDENNKVVDTL